MGDVNGDGSTDVVATAPTEFTAAVNDCGSVSAWTTIRRLCDANPRLLISNVETIEVQ